MTTKISDFTKLFWANRGNHNDMTAQKFLPDFTFDELKEAAAQVCAAADANRTIRTAPESHQHAGRIWTQSWQHCSRRCSTPNSKP